MASPAPADSIWRRCADANERARQTVLDCQARYRISPSEENFNALHAAIELLVATPKFPPGIDVIREGVCPIGARQPIACFLCRFGHMTECHHPHDCADAQCSHHRAGEE